ncbi:hypothetical protein [Bacillus subtilis]
MLEDARGMLVSEISLAQGLSQDEVLSALENELRVL